MSEPMPFAKIRLSLMFAAEHELPIELGTDEVWSVLNKLDQLSAETGKAIARAEAAERELAELQAWQPIETAPKDGTFVLIAEKGEVYKANWQQDYGVICYPTSPYRWCVYGSYQDEQGGYEIINEPIGWQPLPAPPEAENE